MTRFAVAGLAAALLALCGQVVATASESEREIGILGRERLVEALDERAELSPDQSWHIVRGIGLPTEGASTSSATASFPVLYLAGRPRSELTRRIVTGKITVRLAPHTDPAAVARDHGLRDVGLCTDATAYRIFRADPPDRSLALIKSLTADPRIQVAEVMLARQMARRSLPNDPLLAQQWHLKQAAPTANGPIDLNVESTWGTFGGPGLRGRGVRIGIIDDGIEATHPDLAERVDANTDRNWNGGAFDNGMVQSLNDTHGTAVAGLTAAAANNGIGVAGVAPDALLVSLRLIAGPHDDQAEAACFNYLASSGGPGPGNFISIKNCSWGPEDGSFQLSAPGPLARQALMNTTTTGRNGRGTVWVWAVGNGGEVGEDVNLDGYANDIHVIPVGSVDATGHAPVSSEAGACLAVCAPSDSATQPGLVTTDRTRDAGFNPPAAADPADLADTAYTKHFGGTSAAAPQIAGVCALMLQANPNLGWRDVKEILLRTARKVDAADPGWLTNGAGLHFNDRYGAGLVDASAAVALAAKWVNLGPMRQLETGGPAAGAIADNTPAGLVRTFNVTGRRRVEHVTLKLYLTHPHRGDLNITLTSPAGTVSTLARPNYAPVEQTDFLGWTFSTVQMWGEASLGTWTLRIVDKFPGGLGSFSNASLSLWGTDTSMLPLFTSEVSARCAIGESFSHVVAAGNAAAVAAIEPLPPGLTFNAATGVLSGTCLQRGQYVVGFRATNQNGSITQNFKLSVLSLYEDWTLDHNLDPADRAPERDPDRDHTINVLEYAGGGRPDKSDPPPAALLERTPDGKVSLFFKRWPLRNDAIWVVEHSVDCNHWEAIARSADGHAAEPVALMPVGRFVVNELPQPDGSVAVRVTDTAAPSPGAWFRLRALLVP